MKANYRFTSRVAFTVNGVKNGKEDTILLTSSPFLSLADAYQNAGILRDSTGQHITVFVALEVLDGGLSFREAESVYTSGYEGLASLKTRLLTKYENSKLKYPAIRPELTEESDYGNLTEGDIQKVASGDYLEETGEEFDSIMVLTA